MKPSISNLTIAIAALGFLFFFLGEIFLFEAISLKSFYKNGEKPLYLTIEAFSPDSHNRCDYTFSQSPIYVALPSKVENGFTCCDWSKKWVPTRDNNGKVEALCGSWPAESIIELDDQMIAMLEVRQ